MDFRSRYRQSRALSAAAELSTSSFAWVSRRESLFLGLPSAPADWGRFLLKLQSEYQRIIRRPPGQILINEGFVVDADKQCNAMQSALQSNAMKRNATEVSHPKAPATPEVSHFLRRSRPEKNTDGIRTGSFVPEVLCTDSTKDSRS